MRDTSRNIANFAAAAVSINHTGPNPFLQDTGAQITSVDPALAAQPQLKSRVALELSAVTSHRNRNSKEKLP